VAELKADPIGDVTAINTSADSCLQISLHWQPPSGNSKNTPIFLEVLIFQLIPLRHVSYSLQFAKTKTKIQGKSSKCKTNDKFSSKQ
jgi:hypothetical protein